MTSNSTLVIYVVGLTNTPTEGEEVRSAYGIFYDSTKLSCHNSSRKVPGYSGPPSASVALFEGIKAAITEAPRYHNLTIETDKKSAVNVINQAKAKRYKDCEWAREVRGVLDALEVRTERGDIFVDVVYSGKDPLAQKGLSSARALAEEALAEH